jgi:hypothetical protein
MATVKNIQKVIAVVETNKIVKSVTQQRSNNKTGLSPAKYRKEYLK